MLAVAAAAEVGKAPAGVQSNLLTTLFYFINELEFVWIVCKCLSCAVGRNYFMCKLSPLGQKFTHFCFELGEVIVGYFCAAKIDIIIKTIFDSWSDSGFCMPIYISYCSS